MSSLTNQYLEELEIAKQDIKTALEEKGVSPTGGYTSYAEAIDDIYIPKIQEYVTKDIDANGSYWIHTDSGYDAVEEVKVNVEVLPDLQSKSVTITENKTEIIKCDTGYDGLNEVEVNVDVYVPTFETQDKTITITKNGTRSVFPDTGYDGLSSVEITVDVASSGGGGGESKPQIPNGFRFTGGDLALVDFGAYDWSRVYDTSYFFQNCSHSTGDWSNFEEYFNGEVLSGYSMFNQCSNLTSIPQLDTSSVVDMGRMFYNCSKLTTIPLLDTSSVVDMSYLVYFCSKLTTIPLLDTSSVTNMAYMFRSCYKLTTIPLLDTSKVTDMSYMFYDCEELTTIPPLDTSSVTNMAYMFSDCSKLTSIPQLDISSVTNMTLMFGSCGLLTSVRFKGNPSISLNVNLMFDRVTSTGTLYYDERYDYSKIINALPSTWTAVPYNVEEYENNE